MIDIDCVTKEKILAIITQDGIASQSLNIKASLPPSSENPDSSLKY